MSPQRYNLTFGWMILLLFDSPWLWMTITLACLRLPDSQRLRDFIIIIPQWFMLGLFLLLFRWDFGIPEGCCRARVYFIRTRVVFLSHRKMLSSIANNFFHWQKLYGINVTSSWYLILYFSIELGICMDLLRCKLFQNYYVAFRIEIVGIRIILPKCSFEVEIFCLRAILILKS